VIKDGKRYGLVGAVGCSGIGMAAAAIASEVAPKPDPTVLAEDGDAAAKEKEGVR
jgi:hypothetical protein